MCQVHDTLAKPDLNDMINIMRYPDGHKQAVRGHIVDAAAEAFRRHGLAGVSIPALMKRAGLTHGGFYAHFKNRNQLVAEAVESAAADTAQRVFESSASLDDALAHYLSLGHIVAPQHGCVVAALGTDGARQPALVRKAFAKVARGLIARVEEKLNPTRRAAAPSDAALRLTATMVGAIVLSRLVDDSALAQRILKAARTSGVA
jgi:TetR/AcrR family transcriptional regulator, transcriptional repressor for nem operon